MSAQPVRMWGGTAVPCASCGVEPDTCDGMGFEGCCSPCLFTGGCTHIPAPPKDVTP